jgi:hypothetical protein
LEDWRIKISVLWLVIDVAYLADLILAIMEPGTIAQLMTGEMGGTKTGPELLLLVAILLLAPLLMAFLSLTLKNSATRWANIIVGIVYVGLWIIALIGPSAQHPVAYSILITLSKLVASALIVWYAWKSKQKA